VPRNSKSKIDVYADVSLGLLSEKATTTGSNSMSVSLEKRKKQAEEPIYLKRM
jgi:hypothetical protein